MRNFKTITTKLVGLILIASMTLSIASCDKFSSGPKADDVLDVVANYIDLLKGGKYSKAAKLTKSGEDLISDMKLDDESQEFLDKIIATSEYEIEYVDGTKNESANCTLDLTVVDVDDAVDIADSSELSDISKAFKKADTIDKSFKIKLVFDSDNEAWLIKNDSDIIDFYQAQLEKVDIDTSVDKNDGDDKGDDDNKAPLEEFVFTEEGAIEYFESKFTGIQNMNVNTVYQLTMEDNPDSTMTLDEFVDGKEKYYEFMFTDLRMVQLEYEVYESTEDHVILSIVATVPDCDDLADYFLNSPDMIKIFADMMFVPNYDTQDASNQIVSAMINYLKGEPEYKKVYLSSEIKINEDGTDYVEDGVADVISLVVPNMDFGNTVFADGPFLTAVADYAYENGMISDTYYEALVLEAETIGNSIIVEPGSDYHDFKLYEDEDFTYVTKYYQEGDPGIFLIFETIDNYYYYDTFSISLTYNDEVLIDNMSGYCGRNRCNEGQVTLTGPLMAGQYVLTIIGYNGELFATIYINVI